LLRPAARRTFAPPFTIAGFDGKVLRVPLQGAFPEVAPSPWPNIPNEPITVEAFMAKYCEKREKATRRYRRDALLGAARNGTVTMPPLVNPYKSGQPNKYWTHDLLAAWQGFLDEGVDLPPPRPEYRQPDRAGGAEAKWSLA
jgi:hypothetical protein